MRKNTVTEQWLVLLADAIENGEKLQMNYRYEYKGKKLGGFLMRVKRGSNEGLKVIVKSMGVDFKQFSKDPNDYVDRFCDEILACKNPKEKKTRFQTRFNSYVLRRKTKIHKEKRDKLNKIWKEAFKERRTWKKALTTTDRIDLWKAYRYNQEINPEQKWVTGLSKMGSLYNWAHLNRSDANRMEKIRAFFTEKEIEELKKERFF